MSEAGNKKEHKPKKRWTGRALVSLWILAGLPLTLVLWPTLILGIFMAPTLIAAIVERRRKKHMTASVGFLNGVAVLPPVAELWESGQDSTLAMHLASDPLNWAIALVASGCGYLVFISTEWVVAAYYRWTWADRLRRIESNQEQLIESWGAEVATPEANQLMANSHPVQTDGEDGTQSAAAA